MPEDIDFAEVLPLAPLVVVRLSTWSHVFVDTELWSDGFYHPIFAPYCKVRFDPNPLLMFPEEVNEDFYF